MEKDHACIPIKKSDPVVSYRETVSELRAVPLKNPRRERHPPLLKKIWRWGGGLKDLEEDHACIPIKKSDLVETVSEVKFFEHTCAYARWALMHRFLSVRLSVCLSVTGPKLR